MANDREGVGPGGASPETTSPPRVASGWYYASGVVLESPTQGPMLCNVVATSYPPQCGNIELVGWDWTAVDDEESASGTTWGGPYEVVGTWDGERLTLTKAPGPPNAVEPELSDFSTPCPEPAGGWRPVNLSTTTDAAMNDAIVAANGRADFAGIWLDQPIRATTSQVDNDPTNLVLNVRVTGDVAAAERDLRQIWGGALCVSSAERTEAELTTIQNEISNDAQAIKMTFSSIETRAGIIQVGVVFDDGTLQATYDSRYGPGLVQVTSWLQPV